MVKAAARDRHLTAKTAGADEAAAIPLADGTEAGLVEAAPPQASAQGELIEPGRALALTDFDPPSLGAGERLVRLAYRAGIPSSMLVSPIGKSARPRILATVINPLPGSAQAGMALRAGHFFVHGVKAAIAQIDFGGAARMTPPFERVVHSFAWLADLEACAPREQVTSVAERILAAWIDANPKPPSRPGNRPAWNVGNAGTRVLNWLVHAPLILSVKDKAMRERVLGAIDANARWLDRNVTRADDQLAQVAGWCGIVAAGLLMPDGKPRRLFGEAGLVRALGELVGDDGGLLSRSPLGQMEVIALLSRLRACYGATNREMPAAADAVLSMAVPPLLATDPWRRFARQLAGRLGGRRG